MNLQCIIVEDQRPAQKILERFIGDTPELSLVGTFSNALEASGFLTRNPVDLIFLDIHLPKLSGVDFIKGLPNRPMVIFTTAFQEYALTGFELDAIDYLLKPFDFSRFYQAVTKALKRANPAETRRPVGESSSESKKPPYYFARLDREYIKIHFDDIFYLKASGDFVYLHFEDKKLFLSEGLKFWEELLPDDVFIKVHKSYIVRLDRIEKVSGNTIYLNEAQIPIGRSFKKTFLEAIGE